MLKKQKSIIFLDFDGVLCDSVKEAYILARYAYYDIDVHKEIESDKYSFFTKYRYLVSNSWQYYYLMKILEENPYIDAYCAETRFNMFVQYGRNELSESFNKKFIEKRNELMERDFEFWNSLETPTLFLKQLKKILNNTKNCTFAILSTKNKEAIISKFEYWEIKFEPSFIFEKQDIGDMPKGEFINTFMNSHPEYDNSILIDDNVDNIEGCANIENLHAYLTSWGYVKNQTNTKTDKEILDTIKEAL